MTTTSHNATPSNSCFSSVFRRLLCSGGLPTHPSTDTPTTTTNHHHLFKPNSSPPSFKPQSPSPTRATIPAGVVARLMGLDSFPDPTASTRSTRVSLGSIMRSKSASSVDFLPSFDIVRHRRVRTSVSFREQVHTFLEASHHNHNLGNLGRKLGNSNSEMGLAPNQEKLKNSKKGMRVEQEQEQDKKKKIEVIPTFLEASHNLGNLGNAKSEVGLAPNQEKFKNSKKGMRVEQEQDKKKKIEEVPTFLEASHNLGNLGNLGNAKSEVGLAPNQEKFKNSKKGMRGEQEQDKKKKKKKDHKEEEVSSSVKLLKYRRKSRVGFQEEEERGYKSRNRTYNHPLPKMVKHDRRRRVKKQTILKRRSESEYSEEYCMKVVVDVFRLTMEEINGGVWMGKKVDNYNLQEVSYEVGQEILQLLVYEMVDELCSSKWEKRNNSFHQNQKEMNSLGSKETFCKGG